MRENMKKCQQEVISSQFSQTPGAVLSTEETADWTLWTCYFCKPKTVRYWQFNVVQCPTKTNDTNLWFKEFMVQKEILIC